MIKPQYTLTAQVILGFLFSFLLLIQSSTSAQIFVEEGLEWGLNAIISTQTLGGSGVSSIDFDQDGDDDLTLGNNGGTLFYENIEDQFQLIDLGIETPLGEVRSVIWVDINNNGNLDLLISAQLGGVRLYKNKGELQFKDITETCGISTDIASNWGVSFSDINRDGYVDLQLCRYATAINIPDNPSIEPHLWTRLYLNNGDETFTDITTDSGLVIDPSPAFLGVFLDFNNDLWPDNYTIIDRAPGNRLFVNNDGVFSDVTEDHGLSYPNNDFMSNTVADFNNDGYLDIFMTNSGALSRTTHLFENNQGESFSNATMSAGVGFSEFCWGALWIDANNDGWQDLFFATQLDIPNYFLLNDQGIFTLESDEMQLGNDVPSYSAAKGDYNNDGYYDMIVQSRAPDRSLLLMNQADENSYIKITPHGTVSNSMAIGSWVKVYANGSQYVHYTLCGEGYIAQNSQHLIFGLGEGTSVVDSLTIWYPSGHKDIYFNLPADSAYHFYEGETYLIDIITDDTLACEGEQVLLDAGDHLSYLWNTGETTRFIEVDTAGCYSVTATNAFGISASSNLDIEIIPNPIITETISPNACLGDSSAIISLQNLLDTAADSVSWDNGMTGETIDSLFSGDYAYTYTDVHGCVSSGTVSVIDPTELLVFTNGNPADVNQSNGSIDLTIFGGGAPYVIIFEGDTVGANITDVAAGEYTLSVTDAYGCIVLIEVIVESTLSTTRSRLLDSISIYPNLINSGDEVTLKLDHNVAKLTFRIRDINGKILQENEYRDLATGQYTITLSSFSGGVYLYELALEEKVYSGKLMVR
ncbi:MAG: hypothetical protein ACI9D1_000570 [Cryomorphaceae bacterium]|jgi:hypothetical protein